MMDKWTMEMDRRGLYNGGKPPGEDQEILQGEIEEDLL